MDERIDENARRSSESRGRMHDKIDHLDETVRIVGQVAAQAREETKATRKMVDEDLKPATDDFKRMRSFGKWTITAVAFGATALGITLATVGEGVVNWIRSWLRIP